MFCGLAFASESAKKCDKGCPCKEDKVKHCAANSTMEEASDCLKAKKAEGKLSEKCSTHLTKVEEFKKACETDKNKFCKDVVGKKEIHKCLKNNEKKLTEECRDAMSIFRKYMHEIKEEFKEVEGKMIHKKDKAKAKSVK